MSEQTMNRQNTEEAELSDESLEQVSGGETEGGCTPDSGKLSQILLPTI